MSREFQEKPQLTAAESSKEKELTSGEAKKERGRGLLHVPSRSSSQKIQPSPTSTGLSGVTASDPRDSIGGQSKESKGSMSGRHRNGSTSSNQSGMGTGPTNTTGNSQPSSPAVAAHQKKKKGGLLALFNCCGVPDNANGLDTRQDQVHRVEKLAPRPTTASRRTLTPSDQPSNSKTQVEEKETQPQSQITNPQSSNLAASSTITEKRESAASTQDQSTLGQGDVESKQTTLVGNNSTTAPAVTIDPPNATSSATTESAAVPIAAPTTTSEVIDAQEPTKSDETDAEGDIPMPDADSQPEQHAEQAVLTQAREDHDYGGAFPPPPPGPIPVAPIPPTSRLQETPAFVPEQPNKYLLPPQAPEFRGKKCLVLDLDETLVHSSFKVRINCV